MSNPTNTSTRLTVMLGDEDAGLQRLIGLVRRRGFEVTEMQARQNAAGGMEVRVSVAGFRPVDVLIKQIETLLGVRRVGLECAPAAAVA